MEDIKGTEVEPDTSASALVLRKLGLDHLVGKSFVSPDGTKHPSTDLISECRAQVMPYVDSINAYDPENPDHMKFAPLIDFLKQHIATMFPQDPEQV